MNIRKALLASFVLYVASHSLPASAAIFGNDNCFSFPAVAMTPYDSSIQADLYKMTHERVYHKQNKTGQILLYGPVDAFTPVLGEANVLGLDFTYSINGPGTASVSAQLRFVSDRGNITTISTATRSFTGTIAHRFNPVKGSFSASSTIPRTANLTRQDGYYMVRVYINRSSSSLKLSAIGYNLCGTIL